MWESSASEFYRTHVRACSAQMEVDAGLLVFNQSVSVPQDGMVISVNRRPIPVKEGNVTAEVYG